jgi:hypothetical protein
MEQLKLGSGATVASRDGHIFHPNCAGGPLADHVISPEGTTSCNVAKTSVRPPVYWTPFTSK